MKLAALLTCFNRKESTLRCLASLERSASSVPGLNLAGVLVDDGSSDGTAEAVGANFPWVRVIRGDGNLYWAAGMRKAESFARRLHLGPDDYLLWLNDDVVLDTDALKCLFLESEKNDNRAICVGAMMDAEMGCVTYSGLRRSGIHPLRFERVDPCEQSLQLDTFNGNVVLIPWGVANRVGPIDGSYAHALADIEYGLRARRAGFSAILAPRTVGNCSANPAVRPGESILLRWRQLTGPKGVHPRSYARFLRRYGGVAWPIFWLSPYMRFLLSEAVAFVHKLVDRTKSKGGHAL